MVFFNFKNYHLNNISDNIKNINWYRYNADGFYEYLKITEQEIIYKNASNDNKISCTSYYYDKKNTK